MPWVGIQTWLLVLPLMRQLLLWVMLLQLLLLLQLLVVVGMRPFLLLMALLWGRLGGVRALQGALQVLTDPAIGLLMTLHRRGKTLGRGEAWGGRHEPLPLEEDGLTGLPLCSGRGCARCPRSLLLLLLLLLCSIVRASARAARISHVLLGVAALTDREGVCRGGTHHDVRVHD